MTSHGISKDAQICATAPPSISTAIPPSSWCSRLRALAVKVLVTGQDGAVVDAWLPATTSRGGGQRRQREPVEAVFDPIDDRGINRVSEPLGRFDEGDVSGLIGAQPLIGEQTEVVLDDPIGDDDVTDA